MLRRLYARLWCRSNFICWKHGISKTAGKLALSCIECRKKDLNSYVDKKDRMIRLAQGR